MTTSFCSPGGFAPPDPPTRSLAGAPGPAPRAWLTRDARSRCYRGLRPAGPPYTLARGGPAPPPRAGPLAMLVRVVIGASPPPTPYTLARGGPWPRSERV